MTGELQEQAAGAGSRQQAEERCAEDEPDVSLQRHSSRMRAKRDCCTACTQSCAPALEDHSRASCCKACTAPCVPGSVASAFVSGPWTVPLKAGSRCGSARLVVHMKLGRLDLLDAVAPDVARDALPADPDSLLRPEDAAEEIWLVLMRGAPVPRCCCCCCGTLCRSSSARRCPSHVP